MVRPIRNVSLLQENIYKDKKVGTCRNQAIDVPINKISTKDTCNKSVVSNMGLCL